MAREVRYKIFLTHNFDGPEKFIRETVQSVGDEFGLEVICAPPGLGPGSPAEQVRGLLESAEGLVGVLERESSWISNEIGMAYAFRIPICIVAASTGVINGIAKQATSVKEARVNDPSQLRVALRELFQPLKEKMQALRRDWPEALRPGASVERFSWSRFYELMQRMHRAIHLDASAEQGGFHPTLLLGISRGGIIVADVLSRMALDLPIGILEARRKDKHDTVTYSPEPTRALLREHFKSLRAGGMREPRILVVDDVIKSGRSLRRAVDSVKRLANSLKHKGQARPLVKSLVLIELDGDHKIQPDYVACTVPPATNIVLPYGLG